MYHPVVKCEELFDNVLMEKIFLFFQVSDLIKYLTMVKPRQGRKDEDIVKHILSRGGLYFPYYKIKYLSLIHI